MKNNVINEWNYWIYSYWNFGYKYLYSQAHHLTNITPCLRKYSLFIVGP